MRFAMWQTTEPRQEGLEKRDSNNSITHWQSSISHWQSLARLCHTLAKFCHTLAKFDHSPTGKIVGLFAQGQQKAQESHLEV